MKSIVLLFVWVCAALAEGWDQYNDPSQFGVSQYRLSSLPLKSNLQQEPWSDTYWPSFQSGIAHRWNSQNPQDFSYPLLTKSQIKVMSIRQLRALSPAEKFDIFVGRYDFPTVKSEWQRTSPQDARWEGICHGWAPAAIQYEQPQPVMMTNPDNITVPFGSSDVKALLSYFTAEYDEQNQDTTFLAQRCNTDLDQNPPAAKLPECRDVNAGSFHLLISNLIPQNSGFVYDRDRSIQVWNQPIYTYQATMGPTRAPSQGSAPGTKKEQQVTALVTYVKETVPQWDAHDAYLITENYTYWVELDANGKVLGGSHVTWDRPDFVWMVGFGSFYGYFAPLSTLYQASTNQTEVAEKTNSGFMPKGKHALLNKEEGEFGFLLGSEASSSHERLYKTSWSIKPQSPCSSIRIRFDQFHTERYREKVKIYEGAEGEGALVAVLHGDEIPSDIEVHSNGALIVFVSEIKNPGSYFHGEYTIF